MINFTVKPGRLSLVDVHSTIKARKQLSIGPEKAPGCEERCICSEMRGHILLPSDQRIQELFHTGLIT